MIHIDCHFDFHFYSCLPLDLPFNADLSIYGYGNAYTHLCRAISVSGDFSQLNFNHCVTYLYYAMGYCLFCLRLTLKSVNRLGKSAVIALNCVVLMLPALIIVIATFAFASIFKTKLIINSVIKTLSLIRNSGYLGHTLLAYLLLQLAWLLKQEYKLLIRLALANNESDKPSQNTATHRSHILFTQWFTLPFGLLWSLLLSLRLSLFIYLSCLSQQSQAQAQLQLQLQLQLRRYLSISCHPTDNDTCLPTTLLPSRLTAIWLLSIYDRHNAWFLLSLCLFTSIPNDSNSLFKSRLKYTGGLCPKFSVNRFVYNYHVKHQYSRTYQYRSNQNLIIIISLREPLGSKALKNGYQSTIWLYLKNNSNNHHNRNRNHQHTQQNQLQLLLSVTLVQPLSILAAKSAFESTSKQLLALLITTANRKLKMHAKLIKAVKTYLNSVLNTHTRFSTDISTTINSNLPTDRANVVYRVSPVYFSTIDEVMT